MAVILEETLAGANRVSSAVHYTGSRSAKRYVPGCTDLQAWAERGAGAGTVQVQMQQTMPDLKGNPSVWLDVGGAPHTVPANGAATFGAQRCVEGMMYRVRYVSGTVPVTVRFAFDGELWLVVE